MARIPSSLQPFWDDALAGLAAGLRGGAEGSHVFLEDREDVTVELRDDVLTERRRTRQRGCAIHEIVGGSERSEHRSSPEPVGPPLREEEAVWTVAESDALRFLKRLAGEAARRAAMPVRVDARWTGSRQDIAVARPGVPTLRDRRLSARLRLEVAVASRGRTGTSVGEQVLRRPPEGEDSASFVADVVARAFRRVEAVPPPRGESVAVFAPGAGGVFLHEAIGHPLEGDRLLSSRRPAILTIVGRIAPRGVSIVDDPRRGRSAWRIDDEGSTATATGLVREGRVAGCLLDRRAARRLGRRPTGHGRRATFRDPPRPRLGCTFLAPGSAAPEEALEGVREGIYIRRLEAASTDTTRGKAWLRVTDADLVRDGRLERPAQGHLIEVDTVRAIASIDCVASDLQFDSCIGTCIRDGQAMAVSVGAPTFRIGLVRVVR